MVSYHGQNVVSYSLTLMNIVSTRPLNCLFVYLLFCITCRSEETRQLANWPVENQKANQKNQVTNFTVNLWVMRKEFFNLVSPATMIHALKYYEADIIMNTMRRFKILFFRDF